MHAIPVSVVIPTHNRRAFVVDAAQCLVNQAYPREMLQILVVVDRCTDGTTDALKAALGDRIQVMESRAAGSSAALNTGLNAATGEIIITMDDEMQPDASFVLEHVRAHGDDRIAVTGYSPVILRTAASPLERSIADMYVRYHSRLAREERKSSPLDLNAGNMSLRTNDLRSIGGFDESYFFQRNDFELATRLMEKGFEFRYAPDARADQHVAVTGEVVVNRAEPRAVNDVRLAREHPWCIEYLPFHDRLADGTPKSRWKAIWQARFVLVPATMLARKFSRDNLKLINREYGVRYAVAAIRAAGGWGGWNDLAKLAR